MSACEFDGGVDLKTNTANRFYFQTLDVHKYPTLRPAIAIRVFIETLMTWEGLRYLIPMRIYFRWISETAASHNIAQTGRYPIETASRAGRTAAVAAGHNDDEKDDAAEYYPHYDVRLPVFGGCVVLALLDGEPAAGIGGTAVAAGVGALVPASAVLEGGYTAVEIDAFLPRAGDE